MEPERGIKFFELSNELGNVLSTVSDKRLQQDNGNLAYYKPEIVSANDYYPFGMIMPGRKYSSDSYRYGFNGKERDDDITNKGVKLDFGARIYDSRIATWLSIDPLFAKYPAESPYIFTAGNPIYFLDPDGKDRIVHTRTIGKDGTVLIKTQTTKGLYKAVWNTTYNGGGYATKNDYEVFITVDLRKNENQTTTVSRILYGSDHTTEISFINYLKIKLHPQGKDGPILPQLPQLMVFGSNSEDPGWGSKADPSRPVYTVNYSEFKAIMDMVTILKVPEPGADPIKIPELLNEWREQKMEKIIEKRKADVEYPVGSDSCTACGKAEPKDSMNNRADKTENYHGGVLPTKTKKTVKE